MSREHKRKLAIKRRVPVACGNAQEEVYRAGIPTPTPGPDGMYDSQELATYYAKIAQLHTTKASMFNQLGKRTFGVASKDFWHQLNPLHRNFWAVTGGSAGGGMIGGAIGGRNFDPHSELAGRGIGRIVGTLAGQATVSAVDVATNKRAALDAAKRSLLYAKMHHEGKERVIKIPEVF